MNAELQLLRGTVHHLTIERGTAIGMATGLSGAGLAGAATGTLLAKSSAEDAVEFFTCTVGEKRVAGRFTKASFKNGDAIEVAAEPQTDGTYAALAIRRPSDQTIWMFPHCSRGRKAHWSYAIRTMAWIFLALLLISALFFGSFELFGREKSLPGSLWFMSATSGVLSFSMACHLSIGSAFHWRPFVQRAETIFTAFGYRDPSRVDLAQQHKKYVRQHGGKQPDRLEARWVYHYVDAS